MDRFEAMRTLIAAIDGSSLSAASRTLGIPLLTVSRRGSDLEGLLGSQLPMRTSRFIRRGIHKGKPMKPLTKKYAVARFCNHLEVATGEITKSTRGTSRRWSRTLRLERRAAARPRIVWRDAPMLSCCSTEDRAASRLPKPCSSTTIRSAIDISSMSRAGSRTSHASSPAAARAISPKRRRRCSSTG